MTLATEILKEVEAITPDADLKTPYGNQESKGLADADVVICDGSQGILKGICQSLDAQSIREAAGSAKDEKSKGRWRPAPVALNNLDSFVSDFFAFLSRFLSKSNTVVLVFDKGKMQHKVVAHAARNAAREKKRAKLNADREKEKEAPVSEYGYQAKDYEITKDGELVNKNTKSAEEVDYARLAESAQLQPYLIEFLIQILAFRGAYSEYDEEKQSAFRDEVIGPLLLAGKRVIFDFKDSHDEPTVVDVNRYGVGALPAMVNTKIEADVAMLDWVERYRTKNMLMVSSDGDWMLLLLQKMWDWETSGQRDYGEIVWNNAVASRSKDRRSNAWMNMAFVNLIEKGVTPLMLKTWAILCGNDMWKKNWFIVNIGDTHVIRGVMAALMEAKETEEVSLETFRLIEKRTREQKQQDGARKKEEKQKQKEEKEKHQKREFPVKAQKRKDPRRQAAATFGLAQAPIKTDDETLSLWLKFCTILEYWKTGHWPTSAAMYEADDPAKTTAIVVDE